MHHEKPLPPSTQSTTRQLDLPRDHHPAPLPPYRPPVCPQHIWRELSPTDQARVRQTLLQIMQEVIHDAPHR